MSSSVRLVIDNNDESNPVLICERVDGRKHWTDEYRGPEIAAIIAELDALGDKGAAEKKERQERERIEAEEMKKADEERAAKEKLADAEAAANDK